ncbi:hypothetical protein EUZ85_06410 [Hahella sp. KA22]|uniref:hypothetical protein n=1 Tax=Hahella sp. KA22 TaxID=1628392 RepID=UPI000FDEA148|nr:hypothetical protein [Hahella sp. KA22]AZZ90370.1 hypothetical protein ENC22_03860 [Hahella sp. KA22]QAY53740.1 hypothetical protein EUZ85_06410 [Hahella sp. KA22]
MHRATQLLLIVSGALLAQSCSTEQAYYAMRENQRQQCEKYIEQSQYEACMRQANESYDDYERRRKELAKQKP